jgi:hypothetical protein
MSAQVNDRIATGEEATGIHGLPHGTRNPLTYHVSNKRKTYSGFTTFIPIERRR